VAHSFRFKDDLIYFNCNYRH